MGNKKKEVKIKFKDVLVTSTDKKGNIIDGNKSFSKVSGYSPKEYIGKPHNIIRHPDMPKVIFKKLWQYIEKGENFVGIIKNLTKSGNYYWVVTNFITIKNEEGNIIGYKAKRKAVTKEAKIEIEKLYHTLLDIEKTLDVSASYKYLVDFLDAKNMTIREYTEDLLKRKNIFEKLDI